MKYFLALLSTFILTSLKAQENEISNIIGSPSSRESSANIVTDAAGNTFTGGVMDTKSLLVKQNALQQTVWSKTISFIPVTSNTVVLGFLDIIGDTLFGCGDIEQSNTDLGSFYFKMNAQTGALYWCKYELSSGGYLSCMRYANGRFYLVGGTLQSGTFVHGKVMAVSSQTGDMIWESLVLQLAYPAAGTNSDTHFTSATEMRNGKMFVTGMHQNNDFLATYPNMPFVLGINDSGTVFFQRRISFPFIPGVMTTSFQGSRIEYDMNNNIVLTSFNNGTMGTQNDPNIVLTKLDGSGNLLFSKEYEIDGEGSQQVHGLNETANSYVLCGVVHSNFDGLYALKLDKNGNFQKCIGLKKPNIFFGGAASNNSYGNSDFKSNSHYFATSEMLVPAGDINISEIILDEDLNTIANCSEFSELPVIATNLTTQLEPLDLIEHGVGFTYWDGVVIEDLQLYVPCEDISLDLNQASICPSSFVANVTGFQSPTFHWSNGTSSSSNTYFTNSPDTIIVRVLDIRCCELIDTIVPITAPSNMTVSLGNDTTLCFQQGTSFTLLPVVTNSIGTLSYLWNNNAITPSLSVTNSGIYWVEVSDSCAAVRDSIQITLLPFPTLDLPLTLDTCFEIGVGFLYTAIGSQGSYSWSSGSQTATELISHEGIYTCTLTNECGSVTDSMLVNRLPDLDLYFPEDSLKFCELQISPNLLHIETNYQYELFYPRTQKPAGSSLNASGWYLIRAFNVCGELWDSIYVDLQNEQAIFMPNTFTPDMDGTNDQLEIITKNVTISSIHIFNRWGEELLSMEEASYNSETPLLLWDGNYNGKPSPDGIYQVQVMYMNCFGIPALFTGHVNLVR